MTRAVLTTHRKGDLRGVGGGGGKLISSLRNAQIDQDR